MNYSTRIFYSIWIVSFSLFLLIDDFILPHTENLEDYIHVYLKNSLGNICGVVIASLIFIIVAKKDTFKENIFISISVGVGMIIYEFIQKIIPWSTYDKFDILGSIIGLFIVFFIILLNSTFKLYLRSKDKLKTF